MESTPDKDKGTSQGTYRKDPWTWTTRWGLTMEVGGKAGQRGQGGND